MMGCECEEDIDVGQYKACGVGPKIGKMVHASFISNGLLLR